MRNVRRGFFVITLCVLAAATVNNAEESNPHIPITSITPRPGAVISRDTVLKVVLSYSIDQAKVGVELYAIHPLFDSTEPGHSFNALKRFKDGVLVKQPAGTIEFEYAIAGEWDQGGLAKPVVVTFCLMKREAKGSSVSIAEAEPVTYQVASK